MRIGLRLLAALTLGASLAHSVAAQDDVPHTGTFEEALEHHSGVDLRKWKAAHLESVGDRLAIFLEGMLETRKGGDFFAIEHADLQAAFLAESIAEDPFSGWILQVRAWDPEACSHYETTSEALASLPEMIAAGERDAAWTQIADLRDHVAPPGGWKLAAALLVRCAGAFEHAGDREHARTLAAEIESDVEDLRQGVVVAACERLLGEIAREEHDVASAEERSAHSFEIGGKLDSGSRTNLLDEIEALDRCAIDTLLEFAVGESETLVLVVGKKGRSARRIAVGAPVLEAKVRRVLDSLRPGDRADRHLGSFDAAAARELYEEMLRPIAALLGSSVGIVPDGILSCLPFEALVASPAGGDAQGAGASPVWFGREHALVLFARAPLGGLTQATANGAGTLVVEHSDFPLRESSSPFSPLRLVQGSEWLDPERVRAMKLTERLVVLAERRFPSQGDADRSLAKLCEAFHEAGVPDVVGRRWETGDSDVLDAFFRRLATAENASEALGAAESERMENVHPDSWAGWMLHRRY